MPKRLRNEHGLTLIELVMVMALAAILAILAMTLYQDIQRKARLAADEANVAALRSAVAIYYASNLGTFPASLAVVNALVVPAPAWQCSVAPVYDSTNGKVTFAATIADCGDGSGLST